MTRLLLALAAVTMVLGNSGIARADRVAMGYLEKNMGQPINECRLRVYKDVKAGSWGDFEDVDLPRLVAGTELRGKPPPGVDGYMGLLAKRTRVPTKSGRWNSVFDVVSRGNVRFYDHPINAAGKCSPTDGKALGNGQKVQIKFVDDQEGDGAPKKEESRCFIVEKTKTGERLGFRLQCSSRHNPEEDGYQAAQKSKGTPKGSADDSEKPSKKAVRAQ